MKKTCPSFGRRARCIGLLGMGAATLLPAASAIGETTLTASGARAQDGRDLNVNGGALLLAMDRSNLDNGKRADKGRRQPASGAPATHSTLAPPGNADSLVGTSGTPRDDSASPNKNSGNPGGLPDDLGGNPPLQNNFAPPLFSASGATPVSMPKAPVASSFCIGLMGLSWAGQGERLGGQQGGACESGPKNPASDPIIYLRIRLL